MPNLKLMISKSGIAGTVTLRIKVNSTNNFSTATTVASYVSANTTLGVIFNRSYVISSSILSGYSFTGSFAATDEASVNSAISSITYDPSVTQYWFVSLQNSDAGDITRVRSIKLVN
jgi:hypothetical protein